MVKVIIYVEGGCVQDVRATEPCQVILWDQDNIEAGDESPIQGVLEFDSPDIQDQFPVVVF